MGTNSPNPGGCAGLPRRGRLASLERLQAAGLRGRAQWPQLVRDRKRAAMSPDSRYRDPNILSPWGAHWREFWPWLPRLPSISVSWGSHARAPIRHHTTWL